MSEAAQIYRELGDVGADSYARLVKEERRLLDVLRETDSDDMSDLNRVRDELYQLLQDARLVSSR